MASRPGAQGRQGPSTGSAAAMKLRHLGQSWINIAVPKRVGSIYDKPNVNKRVIVR